jgi:hypothetical protein
MYFHFGKTKAARRGRKRYVVKAEQVYALWMQAPVLLFAICICHRPLHNIAHLYGKQFGLATDVQCLPSCLREGVYLHCSQIVPRIEVCICS